jgi:hypothetical protein
LNGIDSGRFPGITKNALGLRAFFVMQQGFADLR